MGLRHEPNPAASRLAAIGIVGALIQAPDAPRGWKCAVVTTTGVAAPGRDERHQYTLVGKASHNRHRRRPERARGVPRGWIVQQQLQPTAEQLARPLALEPRCRGSKAAVGGRGGQAASIGGSWAVTT